MGNEGYFSENSIATIKDSKIYNIENTDHYLLRRRIEFGFIFPQEFDKQKQQIFIDNIKSYKLFNDYKILKEDQKFTRLKWYYDDEDEDDYYYDNDFSNTDSYSPSNFGKREIDDNINTDKINDKEDNDEENYNDEENNDDEENNNNEYNNTEENIYEPDENKYEYNNYRNEFEFKVKVYKNKEEFEIERKNLDYDVDFVVFQFHSTTKYTIHYEANLWNEELYDNIKKDINSYYHYYDYYSYYENISDLYDDVYSMSIIIYQTIVNKAIIKMLAPSSQDFEINYTFLDRQGSDSVEVYVKYNEDLLPLFMLFYYTPCVCNLLILLVIEKESRIKESLVIIGLKKSSFWTSWSIIYGSIILFSSIIVNFLMLYFKFLMNVNWIVLIITLIIYGLDCCCISFILSTLIKKSKTANTISVMVIVAFLGMYFLEMYARKTSLYNLYVYTLSPVSFLSLLYQLITYNQQGIYIHLFSLFKYPILRKSFFGLLLTLVCYFLLAIYLDNVLPQGNNFHRKWNFIFTDLFKRQHLIKSIEGKKKEHTNNLYIQEDPKDMKKAVEIKNIKKSFKVKGENIEILKNIDFNAYYNEIFAILGHNGAGKTTLISIMTGILSSTQGEVYYDEVPITGNETEICKKFGYCPQFDTFNNNLTVGEHVRLFSGIKGIDVDVDSVLEDIDLLSKKDNYPKELSGGQRRKLCITLALLGSPKYVFLDEPTTGLDPYSRKNIWELLSRKKEGCVIFVTTHYMDEADLLADRKMIISNGNISCLGTSLFLKQQFNMNYSLDIHCKNPDDGSLTDKLLEELCPGTSQSKTISSTNMQNTEDVDEAHSDSNGDYLITYLLPMKHSNTFKKIFESINEMIKDSGNTIENFSLTAPTLEELFIRLENSDEMNIQLQKATNVANVEMDAESTSNLVDRLKPVFTKTSLNQSSSLRQIWAIVKLRLTIFLRNKTFALLYTLLPIVFSILFICLVNSSLKRELSVSKYKPLAMTPSLYGNEKWFKEANVTGPAADYLNKIGSVNKINVDTMSIQNDFSISSGKDLSKLTYIGGFYGYNEGDTLQFVIYKNVTDMFALPISIDLLSNVILEQNNVKERFALEYQPFDYYREEVYSKNDENKYFNIKPEQMKREMEPILIVGIALCISLSISIFGPYTVKEREEGITHQLFLNGTSRMNYWLGVFISDAICLFVPVIIVIFTGYLNDISIFHPNVLWFTIIMTIIWGIGCLFNQYVISFFFKKYEKISTMLVILNPIISLVIGIIMIILSNSGGVVIDQDLSHITDKDARESIESMKTKLYIIYACLAVFVPGMIILLYTKLSYFLIMKLVKFSDDELSNFLVSDKAKSIINDAKLTNNKKSDLLKKAFFGLRNPTVKDIFECKDKFIILVLIIAVSAIAYISILILLEWLNQKRLRKNVDYDPEERARKDEVMENGPIDVRNEWKRIGHSISNPEEFKNIVLKVFQINKDFRMGFWDLRAMNKRKKKSKNEESAFEKMDNRIVYDSKKKKHYNRIVNDVTFGVNTSECLGLLGPNGAGKTTTISMITGLLSHTHGVVKYGQKDLNETALSDLSLGYCAQYDSLWKLLTVKETVEFYLNICGYPREEITRYRKALIEACGIEIHTNKKVSEISGGTKRKLSLIIAICSSPSYLILDEPSAGMDPFTRRYLWKLISELKKIRETATILTTHSTEEAEALCDRIAILIKGSLVCIDTPRSIKMNHSNTYTLEVFTSDPTKFEEEIVKKENLFGLSSDENYEVESSISYQKYSVEMKTENIARVFALMENAKEQQMVTQYNFGQYSLEQVFINFINNSE